MEAFPRGLFVLVAGLACVGLLAGLVLLVLWLTGKRRDGDPDRRE